MALSPELTSEIEKQIAELKKGKYRRMGMGINNFISALSIILAQMTKDINKLIAAGLDSSRIPYYEGYLEMLSLTLGDRRGVAPVAEEKRSFFDQQMALAVLDRKRLMVVASFIAEMSSDKSARHNYKEMVKGSGYVDTLCDNLAGVAMVGSYPELASQIKPGGFQITESYCTEVSKRAIELLKLKGFVVEKGVPGNITVDRQNRLITLCVDAISEIRTFARAAFFDDLDYYNSNYASAFRQESGDTAVEPEEEIAPMEKTTA